MTASKRPRFVKPFLIICAAMTLLVVVLAACGTGDALRVASSLTAHELCSTTFVAGRDPDAVFREYVRPFVGVPIVKNVVSYRVDRAHKAVTATVAGMFGARAEYAEGRGCTVVHRPRAPGGLPDEPRAEAAAVGISLREPVGAPDPRLAAAIDRAFAEPDDGPHLGRKAIVVVADGQILAERYAAGYDATTRLQSWSMAKSITHALIGVLVQQGRLRIDEPAPVAAWQAASDPRHAVTIDQLLRQTSGQPFGQSNSGFDASTHMQFLEADTAAIAEAATFDGVPGAQWSYTDGNFAILSGIVRRFANAADGPLPADLSADQRAARTARWIRHALFDRAGMTSALLEYDEAGTPMGADWAFATARDWARFGLLYARDGLVGDDRVLPAGWAAYAASPTVLADVGYGAGFFTNVGPARGARFRRELGAPPDSFFALGNSGQVVFIAPAQQLIVVSLGFSLDRSNRTPVAGAIEVAKAALTILATR